MLKKKRNLFGLQTFTGGKNAIILSENSVHPEKEVFRFVSSEREKIFWKLTLEGLRSSKDDEEEREKSKHSPTEDASPSFSLESSRGNSKDELVSSSAENTPSLEKNNSQEIEEKPQPKPSALKPRPGALKKKKENPAAMVISLFSFVSKSVFQLNSLFFSFTVLNSSFSRFRTLFHFRNQKRLYCSRYA